MTEQARKSDLVEVAVEFRRHTERGLAVWDGERDERNREVWIWVPLALVEFAEGVLTLPGWLAQEKGLL